MKTRKLTVEAHGGYGGPAGEPYRHNPCPKVRLKGRWLEAAGLSPGAQVEVTVVCRGVIELRLIEPRPADPQFSRAMQRLEAVTWGTPSPEALAAHRAKQGGAQ